MGNQKIVNYLKKKYINRKNLFLLTSFYSLIFPFSCFTLASDTTNNYEEKINNPLIYDNISCLNTSALIKF